MTNVAARIQGSMPALITPMRDGKVDEQAFRYNNRKDKSNADRFSIALSQIAGKRLQFKELTGQVEGVILRIRGGRCGDVLVSLMLGSLF